MSERSPRLCHKWIACFLAWLPRPAFAIVSIAALGACGVLRPAARPGISTPVLSWNTVRALDLVAQHVFDRGVLGGVSGLVYDARAGTWLSVSDSRREPQWFQMRFRLTPGDVRVDVLDRVPARAPAHADAWWADFESVAILPNGNLLIASEGDAENGMHVSAALWQYNRRGEYVSSVRLPEKFTPDAAGRPQRGLRDNYGFEGLAFDPDSSRLWALAEGPLAQDDDVAGFDRGARSRLIEFTVTDAAIVPTRELVYPIEPTGHTSGTPSSAYVVDQGVSELTFLPGGVLMAMERGFLRDKESDWSMNVIRLFRIDLDGADDVSALPSLRDAPPVRPIRKQLLADLSRFAPKLDSRLKDLENFEAAAPGPMTADGRPTLLVMSDDNFSTRQVSALLVLAGRR